MKTRVATLIILCILIAAHSDIKGSSIDYDGKQAIEESIQNKSNYDDKKIKKSSSIAKEPPKTALKEASKDVISEKYIEDKATVAATTKNQYIFPSKDPVRAKPGKDKFLVKVAISEQKLYVYKNDVEIKIMECSTGLKGIDSDTPIDNYKINSYYGQSFYSSKYKQGARYWVGFSGPEYLFHSVPTGEDGEIIATEADMIGKRASHGCIRLSVEDAFWFYETIPQGADVITANIL